MDAVNQMGRVGIAWNQRNDQMRFMALVKGMTGCEERAATSE
jgi:hypothetical protein